MFAVSKHCFGCGTGASEVGDEGVMDGGREWEVEGSMGRVYGFKNGAVY